MPTQWVVFCNFSSLKWIPSFRKQSFITHVHCHEIKSADPSKEYNHCYIHSENALWLPQEFYTRCTWNTYICQPKIWGLIPAQTCQQGAFRRVTCSSERICFPIKRAVIFTIDNIMSLKIMHTNETITTINAINIHHQNVLNGTLCLLWIPNPEKDSDSWPRGQFHLTILFWNISFSSCCGRKN